MLTPRQNLMETIKGGKPDRFVKQYEAFEVIFTAAHRARNNPKYGELNKVNNWGVTVSWAEGQPGAFPVHKPDTIVVKDIEEWQEYVKVPSLEFSEAEWEIDIAAAEAIDREKYFVTAYVAPGVFEQMHYLCEITNVLAGFYEYPDELKELIKVLTEYEIKLAEVTCDHIKPDAILHHDDWGTQISTFMDPEMFAEFFLDAYKEIYGYWKERGVQLIMHHSDSYCETIVPYMIEMGIDIWQGVLTTNNIPELVKKYGGQISFMGGINNSTVDYEGWTKEVVDAEVKKACDLGGHLYFIPSTCQGMKGSTFEGVYDYVDEAIDNYSKVYWKEHNL